MTTRTGTPSEWGIVIPAMHGITEISCPVCGSERGEAERVGNRIYGSHDGPRGCGWTAVLPLTREWLDAWLRWQKTAPAADAPREEWQAWYAKKHQMLRTLP
jgi:hypothetical protein